MDEYINGVQVVRHGEQQRHTDVTLTFAVGSRDETLRTIGVAHALEHLVMYTVRDLPIEMNAEVDLLTTTFVASGSTARVGEFLNRLCRALAAPPVDRLDLEARVLTAEEGNVAHPVVALLLNVRYGARGPGLAWLEGPGYDGLTPEHVISFANEWFVPANAVLQVTGPLPEGLELALPSGPAPARVLPVARSFDGPVVVGHGIPASGVLLTLPPDDDVRLSTLSIMTLRQRIEEKCRFVGGHSYEIGVDLVAGPGGASDWIVYAEAREGSEDAVSRAVVAALTDLAENGPTAAELAHQIARAEENLVATDDPEVRRAFSNAMSRIIGEPELPSVSATRLAAVQSSDIAAVLKTALPGAIGYGDEHALEVWQAAGFTLAAACPVIAELPEGRTFKPPLTARAFVKEARSMLWVRTDDALVLRDADGIHQIRWDEVAGVMRSPDGMTLVFGTNGCTIPVDPDMFRGATVVLEELTRRVPSELWFDESKLTSDD
ncbi:insulinase family protein [Kribbella speibonae]|uniref:insulinase family protein n=1 Tax=Kribbella speibonae TaxID=1572660 RepID=UPI0013F48C92|nr:insulinase family protein [Kribbella speibonae]